MSIKHATQTALADDPAYDVSADEWNEAHSIEDQAIAMNKLSGKLHGYEAYVGQDSTKDGLTNYYYCDGTADDVQIQDAIDNNNVLFIEAGTYEVTSSIILKDDIYITGAGQERTILQLGANTNLIKSHSDPATGAPVEVYLYDMELDGNKSVYTTGNHVLYGAFAESRFERLSIINGKEDNVCLVAGSGGGWDNVFRGCRINASDQRGVEATNVDDGYWYDCEIDNHVGESFYLDTCASWTFIGGYIGNSDVNGAYLTACKSTSFHGTRFEMSDQHHLVLDNATYRTRVIGCLFYKESGSDNTYDGIVIDNASFQNVIIGCIFDRSTVDYDYRYHINEVDAVSYSNIAIGNVFGPIGTARVNRGSSSVPIKVFHSSNHVTDNSGTNTGTGGQQTIAHGLGVTPNRVVLSEYNTGLAIPYQSAAADATNIYVTATNTKTYLWRAWLE